MKTLRRLGVICLFASTALYGQSKHKTIVPGETISFGDEQVTCVATDPSIKTDSNGNQWKLLMGRAAVFNDAQKLCAYLGSGWTVPSMDAVKNSSVRFSGAFWSADWEELKKQNPPNTFPSSSRWGYRLYYVKNGQTPEFAYYDVEYYDMSAPEKQPRLATVCVR